MNFRYTFQHAGAINDNFDTSSNYSNENEKDEINCYSGDSVFNGSSISTITKPSNISKSIVDHGILEQLNAIRVALKELGSQFSCLNKKQTMIENQLSTSFLENSNDPSHRKLQIILDHHMTLSHKKIADIVKTTNSNKVLTLKLNNNIIYF